MDQYPGDIRLKYQWIFFYSNFFWIDGNVGIGFEMFSSNFDIEIFFENGKICMGNGRFEVYKSDKSISTVSRLLKFDMIMGLLAIYLGK